MDLPMDGKSLCFCAPSSKKGDYRKKSVLVVCHSVVVLIFRRLLERWNEDEYLKIDREQDVENCSITAYRYEAKMGK